MSDYNQKYDPFNPSSRMFVDQDDDLSSPGIVMGGNGATQISPPSTPPGFSPMSGIGEVPGYSHVQIPFAQGAESRTFSGAIRNGLAMKSLMQNRAAEIQRSQFAGKMEQVKEASQIVHNLVQSGDYHAAAIHSNAYLGTDITPDQLKENILALKLHNNPEALSSMYRAKDWQNVAMVNLGPKATPEMVQQEAERLSKIDEYHTRQAEERSLREIEAKKRDWSQSEQLRLIELKSKLIAMQTTKMGEEKTDEQFGEIETLRGEIADMESAMGKTNAFPKPGNPGYDPRNWRHFHNAHPEVLFLEWKAEQSKRK